MSKPGFETKRSARRYGPVAAALAIGLAGTGVLFEILWHDARQSDQTRFNTLTHFLQERLDDRMEKYEQVLVLAREFFSQNNLPSQTQWRQLLDRLKLPVNYRGLMGLGYLPGLAAALPPGASPELPAAIGANSPLPRSSNPADAFWPLLYSYTKPPVPAPKPGFNLRSSLLWQPAIISGYRNAVEITGCVAPGMPGLPFELHGFYMLHAVYDAALPVEIPRQANETPHHGQERLAAARCPHWQGSLVAAIDVDELLIELVEDSVLEVTFEIFDDLHPSQGQRLNRRVALPSPLDRVRRPDLTHRVSAWPMYAKRWAIVFYPTAEFERRSPRGIAWIALWAGIGITLCITGLVWVELQRRLGAESHARQMNEARDVIAELSREREQISRDLHDGVLQSLYALGLGLQKTRRAIARDPALAEERCRQNLDALELAMAELRRHLGKGGSGASEEPELGPALRHLAEVMNRQGRVPVQFEMEPGLRLRPVPGLVLQLLQIAREAVVNAQRHSGADRIRLGLSAEGGGLRMSIADNGCGFDPSRPPGHGLRNMAARAGEMGAEYRLETRPGGGVRLDLRLPAAHCIEPGPCTAPAPEK